MADLGIGAFHHIGIATDKPDEACAFYEALGYRCLWAGDDPLQQAHIILLIKSGHPMIELIRPISEDCPVYALIHKQGAGPYHTCYEVDNIDATSQTLRKMKMLPTGKKTPAIAFGGRHIRFFYSAAIGLIELVEKE